MNIHYKSIKNILEQVKDEYIEKWKNQNSSICITERDVVSEVYCALKGYCDKAGLNVHTEIKPLIHTHKKTSPKGIGIIDVAVLENINGRSWFEEAVDVQNGYNKGEIEARFSSVPIDFFNTAIEVKIQSQPANARKDIDKLRMIKSHNNSCNCFFILLNARGKATDHQKIRELTISAQIDIIEYTENTKNKTLKSKIKGQENDKKDYILKIFGNHNDKLFKLIESIVENLTNKFSVKTKYLDKINQYKFWFPDEYKDVRGKCFMIIETFKKKPLIRTHTLHKHQEINQLLRNSGFNIRIGNSKLNPVDQFYSAFDIDYTSLDRKKIVKLIEDITNYSFDSNKWFRG